MFVLALAQQLSLLIVFWGYALTFAIRHAIILAQRRRTVVDGGPWTVDGEEKPPGPAS